MFHVHFLIVKVKIYITLINMDVQDRQDGKRLSGFNSTHPVHPVYPCWNPRGRKGRGRKGQALGLLFVGGALLAC